MRLELGPMRALLERLGRPQEGLPVVLVAGTNGKGSVAAMLAAILAASGYRVGLYTSPHLEDVRERIRIDGRVLAEPELAGLVARVLGAAPVPPTYFEALTAAAILAFRRAGVDLAVLEVGLGGRLDATNATDPVLSVVTSIDLDHQALLGSTRRAIAAEKAGIFRPVIPALIGEEREPAASTLRQAARAVGAELVPFRPPAAASPDRDRLEALALEAAAVLARSSTPAIAPGLAAKALRDLWWPGRDEHVALPDGRSAWLDCAHNPAAAVRLAYRLRLEPRRRCLVFGCLVDKDHRGMLEALIPEVGAVYLVAPADTARALSPTQLEALVRSRWPEVEVASGALAATLDRALEVEEQSVITGSFRVVGPARRHLRERFGTPRPAIAPLF